MKNVTVDGGGSLFVFHGDIMILAAIHSENVTFTNFEQDFYSPSIVDVTVVEKGDGYCVLHVPECYSYSIDGAGISWASDKSPVTGKPYFTGRNMMINQCLDTNTGRARRDGPNPFANVRRIEDLGNRRIRITYTEGNGASETGYCHQMRYFTERYTAGMLFWESRNTALTNARIGFLHGFGVVSQYTENVTFDNLQFVPRPGSGRTSTSFADFLQMSGVRGRVKVNNCVFDGPQDDVINVHAHYMEVTAVEGSTCTVVSEHHEAHGFPKYYAGDEVEFLSESTGQPLGRATVREVTGPLDDSEESRKTIRLAFDRPVPEVEAGKCIIENVTYTPEVEITNNRMKHVPTRGILCSTRRRVVIENNLFDGMNMAAILVAGEPANSYRESGAVHDLTVRRNVFNCPYDAAIRISPALPESPASRGLYFHRNISIEDNVFNISPAILLLYARDTDGLRFRNNAVNIYRLDSAAAGGATVSVARLFDTDRCGNVAVRDNSYGEGFVDLPAAETERVTSAALPEQSMAKKVDYQVNRATGAITRLFIQNDARNMNWIMETDGSQYEWIDDSYGWGLGFLSIIDGQDTLFRKWEKPSGRDSAAVTYMLDDIAVSVVRRHEGADLTEEYRFANTGRRTLRIAGAGIYTPFNDNYPDANLCYRARTNVHIWNGANAAYVNATHMSGQAPHLGLTVTEGSIRDYEIRERDVKKGSSNTRGVIVLNPEDMTLRPGESRSLAWRIFAHGGRNDFVVKALERGSVIARSDRYVYTTGDTANVTFESRDRLKNPRVMLDGRKIPVVRKGSRYTASVPVSRTGEIRVEFVYGERRTFAVLLGISGEMNLLRKRAEFIVNHQQLNDAGDRRDGAYMVYDNETDRIFLNDRHYRDDWDEGAERLGMGVFLALLCRQSRDVRIEPSLLKYAQFVRGQLQDDDYTTYSTVDHKHRVRGYNYPWVAHFYFRMFQLTDDRSFLTDGYRTLRAMFRRFGHGFYAIDIPVHLACTMLQNSGMTAEADTLLNDFRSIGDIYVKNGVAYPRHEVNYEQSIVAPSIMTLLQLYLITKENKYLDAAVVQMPLLDAFAGSQPSYRLHDIAIRHWDGYWFGKRETWGDTMPHYWSVLSALAYYWYAQCTGDDSYRQRAVNIVRNNLCLFFEDGRASCAYIAPARVNGVTAQFYDPYANDQDWAAAYYLIINQAQ
jgi:hypothetical protein